MLQTKHSSLKRTLTSHVSLELVSFISSPCYAGSLNRPCACTRQIIVYLICRHIMSLKTAIYLIMCMLIKSIAHTHCFASRDLWWISDPSAGATDSPQTGPCCKRLINPTATSIIQELGTDRCNSPRSAPFPKSYRNTANGHREQS